MQITQAEQKIADEIASRAGALLDDLRTHVNLPTGMGNTQALDETRGIFTDRLRALGASIETVPGDTKPDWLLGKAAGGTPPPTAVCRRTDRKAEKSVLIAGHLDTVHDPAGEFLELNIAPDGKTAVGPGCVDMKGGLVIAVHALEALEACGIDTAWTFSLNSDEETGTYHSENALRTEAVKHDFGIALEPALADGSLAVDRMGSGQFMIECRGRSAHVGREFEKGISAVNALAECLVKVAKLPDADAGKIVSVGVLDAGVATNAVPDRAQAWGNARFPTKAVADEIEGAIRAMETDSDAMPAIEIFTSFNRPAKPLIPSTEQLALAARGVAEGLGQKLPFAKTGGVCDGNILQDAGLPTIDTLGVRGGGLHTPDEWIDLTSLVERCQLLAILIARIARGGVS
ncbi:MAG: M20/M25/M40 family metallo-hydrolase [Planctomycetota bacterium]